MQEVMDTYQDDILRLNSDDPATRREAAEKYLTEDLPDELAKLLCTKMSDEDKGFRDVVGFALTFSNNPQIPVFLVPYISSPDISVRNLAGEILIKRGSGSIDALLRYLKEGDDDDKKFIIDILGLIGDSAPADVIQNLLHESPNENVILACIEALGNIQRLEALDDIMSFYDKNELFRPTVIEAIGKVGENKSLEFILDKYNLADDLTKFSMLEILGRIGDETTFFFLLAELGNITAPLTWAAITSIKNLKEKLSLDVPYDESTKNAILSTLHHGEIDYQRAASALLTFFKDKDILAASFKIYGFDPEIDENIKANFFINKKIFFSEIINYIKPNSVNLKQLLDLIKQMTDIDGDEFGKLSQLEQHNFCSSLADLLSHSDEEVRRISMELIFALDESTAFIFIDLLCSDSNVWNKMKLLDILENIFNEEANKALKTLINDEEEMVKERAIMALNQRRILN
ncbi:MAG: HEAT repeat domain-containing protein [Ignavibacteriales bacterium]|nr:HEAT repeat domain-containing protein [Ignavibacteriales bacterium]